LSRAVATTTESLQDFTQVPPAKSKNASDGHPNISKRGLHRGDRASATPGEGVNKLQTRKFHEISEFVKWQKLPNLIQILSLILGFIGVSRTRPMTQLLEAFIDQIDQGWPVLCSSQLRQVPGDSARLLQQISRKLI